MTSEIDLFRATMASRATFGTPATEAEIAEFENRYSIQFPADIREYFLKINGVYQEFGFISIEPLINWCPLSDYPYSDRDSLHHNLANAEQYFRFGNYDYVVWDWSIRLNANLVVENPVMVTFQSKSPTQVANTFTEFLHKFRTDYIENLLGD